MIESQDAEKATKERAEEITASAKEGKRLRLIRRWLDVGVMCGAGKTTLLVVYCCNNGITMVLPAELLTFKKRRVAAFRKGIVQYTQVQIRQGRGEYELWKNLLQQLRAE